MLREPRKFEDAVQARKDKKAGRFRLVKLEERIAPAPGTGAAGCTQGNKSNSGRC